LAEPASITNIFVVHGGFDGGLYSTEH